MLTEPAPVVAAADIGGSHLSVALADRQGTLLARTDEPVDRFARPGPIIDQVAAAVAGLRERAPASVAALAVACPGVIDAGTGLVHHAVNFMGWEDVPLGERLAGALGLPVRVENDGNMGAVGEGWRGAGRGLSTYVFVALGTGVGGGVVLNGRLWRGTRHYAGEIGQMIVAPTGSHRPRLEQHTGAPALARWASDRGYADVPALFAAAFAGDNAALAGVDGAARYLAAAFANICSVLDPEAIIIGGGISRQGERFLSMIGTHLAEFNRFPCPLLLAQLGADAQLYGAVRTALDMTDIATDN